MQLTEPIEIAIAGWPALLIPGTRDSAPSAMFCPTAVSQARAWLRWPSFDGPLLVFGCHGLSVASEPDAVAADLLNVFAGPALSHGLNLFGFSGGTPLASLVAAALVRTSLSRVRLILANPLINWWPLPENWRRESAEPLRDKAASDEAFRTAIEARANILQPLADATRDGLRTCVVVSADNAGDALRARRIADATGAKVVTAPTADHNLMPWLQPEIYGSAERPGMLPRTLGEIRRRREPDVDQDVLERDAMIEAAEMRTFWRDYPGLQALAERM